MVRCRGFTLIEVLVALVVIAIGMSALIRSLGMAASHADDLRNRTFAHWVAMNQAAAWTIFQPWPELGEHSGEEEMGGQLWHWRVRVVATEDDQVRQWSILVRDAMGRESGHLVCYLGKPNPPQPDKSPIMREETIGPLPGD